MRREYYLSKHKNGIYYVEFIDSVSGKKLSARSTGETDQIKAQVKAELWKQHGIPTGRMRQPRPIEEAAGIKNIIRLIRKAELMADDALRIVFTLKTMGLIDVSAVKNTGRGSVPFIQFLKNFWDYDKSEYIQDRLSHGYRFSRQYAHECQNRLKAELVPYFGEKKLNCVTTDDLKTLSNQLAARGLATSTINQILLICCTPLKWAFNEKIIPSNPCQGLTKFSIKNRKRGVLNVEEAKALFLTCKELWKDKRAYVGSLVAASTGARMSECLALRRTDIGEKTIHIAHRYVRIDHFKEGTKNEETRNVPLLPIVRAALLDLLNDNPHLATDPPVADPFIFYSLQADKPCDNKVLLDGLKETIASINNHYVEAAKKANHEKPEIAIDQKGRNITFHSWRHFFCSKSTQKISGEKVAKVSGHLTKAVFDKYADHVEEENVQEVGNAIAEVFQNIIPFTMKKVV